MRIAPQLYARPAHALLVLQEDEPSEDDEAENKSQRDDDVWSHGPSSQQPSHEPPFPDAQGWRSRTLCGTNNAVLALCLNVSVQPPDIPRPKDRGRMECWHEPDTSATSKSGGVIKERLIQQYRRWHPNGKFKAILDPTVIEVQRMTRGARRHAKQERVMFHYNGHGVPWPTETGEIWMFNSTFSKYLPLNLADLHSCICNPSLYIFDVDHAGLIVDYFRRVLVTGPSSDPYGHQSEFHPRYSRPTDTPFPEHDCVVLASCGPDEQLPFDPHIPADLFTSCLTTPIRTALIFYARRSLITGITPEMIDKMPGDMESRNTPLGDLARIFTTISDTIAWNILPPAVFRRLFRQDLLLASMMRNYLLACRIMSFYDRTPMSIPELPTAHKHPLWDVLEFTMEQYLAQLPANFRLQQAAHADPDFSEQFDISSDAFAQLNKAALLREEALSSGYLSNHTRYRIPFQPGYEQTSGPMLTHNTSYEPSSFFEDQIKAFEVGLDQGIAESEQLPMLLLLLIQSNYRMQGLRLLSRYLELGRRAVELALSIGIFPYVLQYLTKHNDLTLPYLVLIWGKILTYDPKCHIDLAKIHAQRVFLRFLEPHRDPTSEPSGVHLAVALFIISVFGAHAPLADDLHKCGILKVCLRRMAHPDPLVCRWACLCMTQILGNCKAESSIKAPDLRNYAICITRNALSHSIPDIRAAGVSAIAEVLYRSVCLLEAPVSDEPGPSPNGDAQNFADDFSSQTRGSSLNHSMRRSKMEHGESPNAGTPPLSGSFSANGRHRSHKRAMEGTGSDSQNTRLDAGVLENRIIRMVGNYLAKMGLEDSSVLVRREIAIALARICQEDINPFVHAAQHRANNAWRSAENILSSSNAVSEEAKCYADMYATFLELAFDPHPVIAGHALPTFNIVVSKSALSFSDDGESGNKRGESGTPVYNNMLPQSFDSQQSSSSAPGDHGLLSAVIHVRSSSGRFDLNNSLVPAPTRMPRVNSASLIGLNELESLSPNAMNSHFPRFLNDEVDPSFDSPPGSRLMAGVSNLFRLPFGQGTSSLGSQRSLGNGLRSREGSMSNMDRFASPRRPRRRSRSYQVIAPEETNAPNDSRSNLSLPVNVPVEKAVDSLLSWSSACISRVAFGSNGPDHMPVPDPVPQYTKLWDSILNPKEEDRDWQSFPLISEGMPQLQQDCNLQNFKERSTFQMGAGGGAVISIAFLPREVGREGDQYIVTGDSTGSVGVYDALDGQCQSSFGIPGPAGMPCVDVTSVMCLNGRDSDGGALSIAQQTPLILAGSYDGRVAVYRSNLISKKYSVLSAWQASGPSMWGSLRLGESSPKGDRSRNGILDNSLSEMSISGGGGHAMGRLLRSSGNGLVLGFRSYTSSLCAAGCEGNAMKVWNVEQERCSWKGMVTAEGCWPTAISVPPWEWCRDTVVVGHSDGRISLVDTRMAMGSERQAMVMGMHKHPIVSLGHRLWIGDGYGETIVSADCEGEIVLWDVRANDRGIRWLESDRNPVRAHESCLTTMAAHPSGNYIASGSTAKCVKVFGVNTSEKDHLMIRTRRNGLRKSRERISPVTSLAFHQQEYTLAFGCSDGSVTMYGTD